MPAPRWARRLRRARAPGASTSDRNTKNHIARIDEADVLDKVSRLPISYTTEHGVRHIGPMAQNFYAAFGREDDKHITSSMRTGVALSPIKALHAHVKALDSENAQLRAYQREPGARQGVMHALRAYRRQPVARQAVMQREIDALVRSVREHEDR